ncbi:MAG: hypothetical protein M3R36_09835 [Bacteroidota bacterium]|nr:hypothetical protein [Bacteroidota bacterium]
MEKTIFFIIVSLFFLETGYAQYTENYAGSFNGTNTYISVPNPSGFSTTGAIALEAWVYSTQLLGTTMAVIWKNYQNSYFLGIQTSGRVVFYPKSGASFRSRVIGKVCKVCKFAKFVSL